MKLFTKSGSSSASSPEAVSGDISSLTQELRELKLDYGKANEVGGVMGVVSACQSVCVCGTGVGWTEGEGV